MTVTYKYKSLNEFADYVETKAVNLRSEAALARKIVDAAFLRGEAYAHEQFGRMLRNTIIES
jgi:hypothetical protein